MTTPSTGARPGSSRRRGETHCRLTAHGATACPGLSRPWRSQIFLDGRNLHLGYFSTAEEARAAHSDAVKENLGAQYLMDQKPIRGVGRATWSKRPNWAAWRACPRVDGRRKHLGYFQTQDEAAEAVDAYLKAEAGPELAPRAAISKAEAGPA
jgi:hypothetical protein